MSEQTKQDTIEYIRHYRETGSRTKRVGEPYDPNNWYYVQRKLIASEMRGTNLSNAETKDLTVEFMEFFRLGKKAPVSLDETIEMVELFGEHRGYRGPSQIGDL